MDLLVLLDKKLTRFMEWVLVGLFAIFLVLVCVLVALRYGFSESIVGGNEFVTIAFLFTSAIGGAVLVSRREHIAITYFIDMLPKPLKMAAYLLQLLMIAVVNGAMIYYTKSWIEQAGHFPWEPFGFPQGFVHGAIPLGCGLAVFYCFLKAIFALAGREQIDLLWMPED